MRLFFAVDVPAPPAVKGVIDRLRSVKGAKVPSVDDIHITLRFIGEVDEELVGPLSAALDRSVEGVKPFTMRLRSVGCFPHPSRPRVLWVGIEDGGVLKRIAERLETELGVLGFVPETREFRPHLTLARLRYPSPGVMEGFADLEGRDLGSVEVKDVRLKSSVLTPSGARHSIVHLAPLEAAE